MPGRFLEAEEKHQVEDNRAGCLIQGAMSRNQSYSTFKVTPHDK